MADFLNGKKTLIAGFVVSVLGFLAAMGVHLPFSAPTDDAVVGVLGILVMVIRLFTSKPGVLASPSSKS